MKTIRFEGKQRSVRKKMELVEDNAYKQSEQVNMMNKLYQLEQ